MTSGSTYYNVITHTGEKSDGNDINAYVILKDDEGNVSEEKQLVRNQPKEPYQKGGVDHFGIEVKEYIGNIDKITIGHRNMKADWYCDKVVIECRDEELGTIRWTFPCGDWFSCSKGDHKTHRELEKQK